ncbi:hypothetical protein D3C72_961210 [compost metagenome]
MLLTVQAYQRHPQQRTGLQVEGLLRFRFSSGQHLIAVEPAQVQVLDGQRQRGQNLLQRLPLHVGKNRAQRFMTLNQRLEAGLQSALIQFATQAQRAGDVVGGAVRLQLPKQPQPVLRRRLRQRLGTTQALDCAVGRPPLLLHGGHCDAEIGQRWGFEQSPYAQLQAQLIGQAGSELGGGNGVASKQEEVVVIGHLLQRQLLTPQTGNQAVQRVALSTGVNQ